MLKALGKVPHANQLGTTWEYSLSTDVLGLMLERVAEKPLDPLGMADTRLVVPAAKAEHLAEAFDVEPAKAAMKISCHILEDQVGRTYFKGGAGLVGTSEDYVKFAQMVLNGGELNGRRHPSPKTV